VHQVQLTICEEADQGSGIKCAIEMVVNALVRLLGSYEARGRLLYDVALSYSNDVRPEGVVFQRNPLNSFEQVWICIVDFPCEVHEWELKYLVTLLLDGNTSNQMLGKLHYETLQRKLWCRTDQMPTLCPDLLFVMQW